MNATPHPPSPSLSPSPHPPSPAGERSSIIFDAIRHASLAQANRLLADWFPAGRRVGREFKIGNISGDAGESLSVNLATGKWADFADGVGGHDLIDLRAAMRHGGSRVEAARELGAMLGITMNGYAYAEVPRREQRKADDGWQPTVPPPVDAPKPDPAREFNGFDVTYQYCSVDDQVLFYVRRREAQNGQAKTFVPLTYGTLDGRTAWHAKAPSTPRPLYGLNRLSTMPDATVLLCEGEKAADAAQAMFPDCACISWFGGSKATDLADFSPLHGRDVIIWPDNDKAGAAAAAQVAKKLPRARLLRVDDLGDGDDAADVSPDDPNAWLRERILPPDAPGDREKAGDKSEQPAGLDVQADGGLITEDNIALAFAQLHGDDLRYCHHTGAWFRWTGYVWKREDTKLAFSWARRLARELAKRSDNFKAMLSAGKASFASGAERMAQTDRAFAVTNEIWNQDPWLLRRLVRL
jgi:D5 N terminal like/Domain of unknown function (DUF6371)